MSWRTENCGTCDFCERMECRFNPPNTIKDRGTMYPIMWFNVQTSAGKQGEHFRACARWKPRKKNHTNIDCHKCLAHEMEGDCKEACEVITKLQDMIEKE